MDVIRAGLVSEEHEANDMPAPSLPFKPVFGSKAPPPPEPQIALHPDDVQAIREVILEAAERVGMTPGAAEGHAVSFLTFAQRLRVFPLPVATERMLDDSAVQATVPSTAQASADRVAEALLAGKRIAPTAKRMMAWAVRVLIQARIFQPPPVLNVNAERTPKKDIAAILSLFNEQEPLTGASRKQLRWALKRLQLLGDTAVDDFFRREEPLTPTSEFLVSHGATEDGAAALAEWINWWERQGREKFKRS